MIRIKPYIYPLFAIGCLCLVNLSCKPKKQVVNVGRSHTFEDYLIDANIHFINSNYALAIKNLEKCEKLKPEEANIYFLLSKNYYGNQQINPCLNNAEKACKIAPNNVYYILWYAEKLKQNRQTKLAIQVLENHLSLHVKDDQYVQVLDQMYSKNGYQSDVRIALLEQHKKAIGYRLNTQVKLIDLYIATDQYNKAHALYDEIKKASPGKLQYFIDDANLYLKTNDENSANAIYKAALLSHPDDFKLNYNLFKFSLKTQQYTEATKYLKQSFNDPKMTVDEQLNICQELLKLSHKDSLYLRFLPVLIEPLNNIKQPSYKVLQNLAEINEAIGQLQAAYLIYVSLNEQVPSNYQYWLKTLSLAKSLQHADWVIISGNKAIEAFPTIAELYYLVAEAYNQSKQYNNALELASTGKSFSADDAMSSNLLVQIGKSETHLKQFQNAKLHLENAIQLNPNNFVAYECLGDAYAINNQKALAIDLWKKSQMMGNKNPVLLLKLKHESYIE